MTAPRKIVAGTSYMVTRRCSQRQLLLTPSSTTNDLFLFLLAVAAQRYAIRIHAFCVMSNHLHIILTDTEARLPRFHQFLDALLARSVNASLARWESFWAPDSYSAVELVSREDVVEKIAYVLANPVAAGLVRTGAMWPGAWSDPDSFGAAPREVSRPKHFFAKKSVLPQSVGLELTVPEGFDSCAQFKELVAAAVAKLENEARARFSRAFKGVAWVLKQSPFSRPASVEPRRRLNPRVAAKDKHQRIEALALLKEFVRAYRRALAERRAGNAEAVFPAGTYLLRVAHGVRCAECT
jgi:REP element-mobilizing transposase RayT